MSLLLRFRIMKPNAVSSIVFVEDQRSSSSPFLLQGAIHYAEQGYHVCVISKDKVETLPPPIHGIVMPGADVFSLIRFVYLSKWQDLLQHLYSIHTHAQVPSAIVFESIDKYFISSTDANSTVVGKTDVDYQHAALLCASILDAMAVCAERLKKRTHMLISLKESSLIETTLNTILSLFFTDFIWFIKTEPANNDNSEDKIVLTSNNKKHVFSFSQPKDMVLYLKEIINANS